MPHQFELCRGRDQVVDYYVSIGASTDKLGASLSAKDKASHSTLMEGELMGELKSGGRKFV